MENFKSVFEGSLISLISTADNNGWAFEKNLFKCKHAAFCIMNICCVNITHKRLPIVSVTMELLRSFIFPTS